MNGINEVQNLLDSCIEQLHSLSDGKHLVEDVRKKIKYFMNTVLSSSEDRQKRLDAFQLELDSYGTDHRLLCYKIAVFDLYLANFIKISSQLLPDAIEDYVREDFARALKIAQSGDLKKLSVLDSRFLCYLEVLNFQRFPLGNQDVTVAGFSRSLLKKQSVSGGLEFSKVLLKCRGNSPLFELHFNPHRLRKFNPDGWKDVLRLAADLLLTRKDLKGVFGAAWFFDPALSEISPELKYLRDVFLKAGGHMFFVGRSENDRKNAFSMSKIRKLAYENGSYDPASYMVIVPRSVLLNYFNLKG